MTVSHIEYHVTDLDAASAFYKKMFGWRFVKYADDYFMATPVECPVIGLVSKPEPSLVTVANVFVTVGSINESLKKADTVIAERTLVKGYGYYAQIADPDGNVIGLFEELRRG